MYFVVFDKPADFLVAGGELAGEYQSHVRAIREHDEALGKQVGEIAREKISALMELFELERDYHTLSAVLLNGVTKVDAVLKGEYERPCTVPMRKDERRGLGAKVQHQFARLGLVSEPQTEVLALPKDTAWADNEEIRYVLAGLVAPFAEGQKCASKLVTGFDRINSDRRIATLLEGTKFSDVRVREPEHMREYRVNATLESGNLYSRRYEDLALLGPDAESPAHEAHRVNSWLVDAENI